MTYTEKRLEELRKSFRYELVEMNLTRDMHNRPPLYEVKDIYVDEIESFFKAFLLAKINQAIAEERDRVRGEIRKRRDSLSISTKFAVMMMSQRGDAGKMAKELRELGGYQALDDLLSLDTNHKDI